MKSRAVRRLPPFRSDLIGREFAGEFVVLDPGSGIAHALSGDVAEVWRCAQAGSWPDHLSDERIAGILAGLAEQGLLTADVEAAGPVDVETAGPADVETAGHSRRTVLKAGAAGGATLALAGLSSIALPSAAMAASNPFSFDTAGAYALIVPDLATFTFTLVGAGGGGGGGYFNAGSSGGDGATITGTITNHTGAQRTLTVDVGGGGGQGSSGGSGGAGGASGFSQGGSGGGSPYGGGGGGGGATAILIGGVALAVAGAGGGGGGGSLDQQANSPGAGGGTTSVSGAGGTAGEGSSSGNGGGGGGGGGASPGGVGGAQDGGYGGSSYFPAQVDYLSGYFSIELTATPVDVAGTGGPGSGGGAGDSGDDGTAGSDGSATVQYGGISL